MSRTMKYACPALSLMLALGFSVASPAQNLGPCPTDELGRSHPHAHVKRTWEQQIGRAGGEPVYKTHYACSCDDGYKVLPGTDVCGVDETKRKRTRAECMGEAGQKLAFNLEACKLPGASFGICLQQAGVKKEIALCATGALTMALSAAAPDATVSKVITVVSVKDVLEHCGWNGIEVAEKCQSSWGTCADEPLRVHKSDVKDCQSKY